MPSNNSQFDADEFVDIMENDLPPKWPHGPHGGHPGHSGHKDSAKEYYHHFLESASGKHSSPSLTGADALHRLYPKHSLVMTEGRGLNLFQLPGLALTPIAKSPLVSNLFFIPFGRAVPGVLVDQIQYAGFNAIWKQYEFIIYLITYPAGFGMTNQYFILHEGPEEVARLMILSAGTWANELHDEIWVFNQGLWQKDAGLWQEIQKADWKDVILKDEFKRALQKDVYGFFSSEDLYKRLAIPWKRGLIMYGPPGNGKTISLKAIMKTCQEQGNASLYVKSFQSWMGEEYSMAAVFNKARSLAPCVLILEDLDSLINDGNRSFFLNQLDGLEGNDGLLIIGTTNHFDRLDPGLSTRPSRFDRKYIFEDPDEDERRLYAQYWQHKLDSNPEIDFPDSLVDEIAKSTDKFSFAYLKEAFVSALVTFAGEEEEDPVFAEIIKGQIETLRKQLDKSVTSLRPSRKDSHHSNAKPNAAERDFLSRLQGLSLYGSRGDPVHERHYVERPTESEQTPRDVRSFFNTVSSSINNTISPRIYEARPNPGHTERSNSGAFAGAGTLFY